jgi:hypothetical protein
MCLQIVKKEKNDKAKQGEAKPQGQKTARTKTHKDKKGTKELFALV